MNTRAQKEENMMEAIRLHKTVEKDGEIVLTRLPRRKGQSVEMIVLIDDVKSSTSFFGVPQLRTIQPHEKSRSVGG